jgi:hypothetical protein
MKLKYRNQILAVFFTLTLSHMASATLITVEADVLANTGTAVTFAQFDQSLGTLSGAHLTYRFAMSYAFFNNDTLVVASDWNSNFLIWFEKEAGRGLSTDLGSTTQENRNDIQEGEGLATATLTGTVDLELSSISDGDEPIVNVNWGNPTVKGLTVVIGPGNCNGDLCSIAPYISNFDASATLSYFYERAPTVGTLTPVPTPPTLALFTLGLMGLAARRCKKKS